MDTMVDWFGYAETVAKKIIGEQMTDDADIARRLDLEYTIMLRQAGKLYTVQSWLDFWNRAMQIIRGSQDGQG